MCNKKIFVKNYEFSGLFFKVDAIDGKKWVKYGKPIVAIFNNLIYIQFSIYIYLFNLIFLFMNFVFFIYSI